ncbi:MAG: NADH-quinone oxidoreductase subunit NuoK [Bacteroidaceae bacterium]|nr:NADH-quinone oxidoreductase subunit NuoK [Bacteroidaceae bacterium]
MIQMEYFLILSAIMMFAGIFGFLTRRSTLAILLSIELMLNATDINFAVFNRFMWNASGAHEGYFFSLFSIAISAAESAIAIAIMINIYRHLKDISIDKLQKMKW